jgi:hypothetical protein
VQLYHTQCNTTAPERMRNLEEHSTFQSGLAPSSSGDCRRCKLLRSACRQKAPRPIPVCRHPISQKRMKTSAKSAPLCFSCASYGAFAQHLLRAHVHLDELSAPVIQRYLVAGTGWVRRQPPLSASMLMITAGRTCRRMSRVTCGRWWVCTDEREQAFSTNAI